MKKLQVRSTALPDRDVVKYARVPLGSWDSLPRL